MTPTSQRPQDAVITGGSSGIGLACAEQYLRAGGRVVVGDLQPPQAHDHGDRLLFVETDVTDAEACADLVAKAVAHLGRVPDVGVSAAGIAWARSSSSAGAKREAAPEKSFDRTAGHVVNLEPSVLERLLKVNLFGTVHFVQALAQTALEAGTPTSIVTVSSAAGSVPLPGGAAYCASKAAVEMVSKVMALELARDGIRVNVAAPGYIETPMTSRIHDGGEAAPGVLDTTPMGRMGSANEVADGIVFLGSARSSYMTGQVLAVSGGQFVG